MNIRISAGAGKRAAKWCGLVIAAGVLGVLGYQPNVGAQPAGGGKSAIPQPAEQFSSLGMKFDGAASCSNAQCHGASEPDPQGATTKAEYTQWNDGDKHRTAAYEQLTNDEGKAIADAMKIEDATTSARCVTCHALSVPENLQGVDFNVEEGVSCASCHGPSEKWREAHAEEGWTQKERKKAGSHDKLLKQWGLYDTKSPVARANMCTSCHLAIDADLIAAGHPQPYFELDYFSRKSEDGGLYEGRHWRDPQGAEAKYYSTRLWAAGQAIAVRDAMKQLAQRASGKADAEALTYAYNQAMAHYTMASALSTSGAVAGKLPAAAALKPAAGAATAKTATEIANAADKWAAAVEAFKPDKAKAVKLLTAVANADVSKYDGPGQEQQAFAIYALYNDYAVQEKPADAEATGTLVAEKLFPEEEATPEQYKKNLDEVKAKLPK